MFLRGARLLKRTAWIWWKLAWEHAYLC